jgi:pimeloyl-ACP methyl ester carboxylesterase
MISETGIKNLVASLFLVVTLFLSCSACGLGMQFIFSGSSDVHSTPEQKGIIYEDVRFPARDGPLLHGWIVPGREGMPLVLFFHGNAANVTHRVENLVYLHRLGLSVFIFDYRGFGISHGRPTDEEDLYQDARGALHFLEKRGWSSSEMIYYGRSMGGAVALQMALEIPPAGVVLEGTFTSLADMSWHYSPMVHVLIGWWNIGARFDNLNKIACLSSPVLIFHGDEDEVVPVTMSLRLFGRAREPKIFHRVIGAGHSNAHEVGGEGYRQAWVDFIDGLSMPEDLALPDTGISHSPKKAATYFAAVKRMTPASIHFMVRAGTNFWERAPRYIPTIPPSPNRPPRSQSGATDMPG